MRTGRKIIGTLIVIAVLLSVAFAVTNIDDNYAVFSAKLYFMNETFTSICEEARDIKYESEETLPELVLYELQSGPSQAANVPFISKKTDWEITKKDTSLTVDFTQDFLTTDNSKNLLATYAVVKSLCSIEGVSEVKVTVDGGELVTPDNSTLDFLTDKDINLETDAETSENRNIKLYFLNEDGILTEEWRNIKISDTVPVEQYVVNELIKGPSDTNLKSVLASDTKLISVEVTEGTAYINMTQGFVDKHKGTPEKEAQAVYAIVNSVTALDGVDNVQFLIDGKKEKGFDTIDLTMQLSVNG
ncbi:MAG: GerMN domain-containing protein [Clostridia bacterium]|nr:GerMN domain-containing protein [Clostridia bacterium]